MLLYSLEEAPFIQTFALKSYSILQHHHCFRRKIHNYACSSSIWKWYQSFIFWFYNTFPDSTGTFYNLNVICFLILISIHVFPNCWKVHSQFCFGLVETPHSNSNLLHCFSYISTGRTWRWYHSFIYWYYFNFPCYSFLFMTSLMKLYLYRPKICFLDASIEPRTGGRESAMTSGSTQPTPVLIMPTTLVLNYQTGKCSWLLHYSWRDISKLEIQSYHLLFRKATRHLTILRSLDFLIFYKSFCTSYEMFENS